MIPGRQASVVLVHGGAVVGVLPPVQLELPWWPEVHDVVAAVRDRDGLEITVLRLLGASSDRVAGGQVAYLAETDRRPPPGSVVVPTAWSQDLLVDHPLRQPWARPGGPAEVLAWADRMLREHGRSQVGPAEQRRTWNLSAVWCLPTEVGRLWLKTVPDFFAHEGAVIDWIGVPEAPPLIGFAPGRVLMAEIPGEPNHDVRDPPALCPMVELLTGLQCRVVERVQELLDLGVPDRRLPLMMPRIAAVVEEWSGDLDRAQRRLLGNLVGRMPARLAAVAECGVPDTLVHGDFHPGNVAGLPSDYVMLDWGDSFIGHPLIDELAFVERLPSRTQVVVRSWFVDAWRRIVPGSDPARAAQLLEPVASLLAAVMYAEFCARIEPDERIYHRSDVGRMLRRAADPTL